MPAQYPAWVYSRTDPAVIVVSAADAATLPAGYTTAAAAPSDRPALPAVAAVVQTLTLAPPPRPVAERAAIVDGQAGIVPST